MSNPPELDAVAVRGIVGRALEEDLGRGDITTDACVFADQGGVAVARAREELIYCGSPLVIEVFRQIDPELTVSTLVHDGDLVQAGAEVARISGRARSILKGERVALNFIQRLSGIATVTYQCVRSLPATGASRITETRKTTPGLRVLERYAVRCGGGHNHRVDLGAAVMIKDNHVAAAGGVAAAISRARSATTHTGKIACEVDDLTQLGEALDAGADIVVLDNFTRADILAAVETVGGAALVEVTGGITPSNVANLAVDGVDAVSMGALTLSATAVDIGLDWEPQPEQRAAEPQLAT